MSKKPKIVIIGGGFGGIAAAQALAKTDVEIMLLDRTNHHLFQPLLYQVATAALSAPDIAAPIRKVLRKQKNVTVYLTEVERIDLQKQVVVHEHGEASYDYLVVAAGAQNNYFGNDAWREHAPGLKTIVDALEIRARVLMAYEEAELAKTAEAREPWLTFVSIGGGATGVELAGALSEIATRTLARDFRNFSASDAKVLLLEGGDRLLTAFPEDLSAKAQSQLETLGVEVRLGTMVADIDAEGVTLKNGERIQAKTVVWGAGVVGNVLGRQLVDDLARGGRVPVKHDLTLSDFDNVFVIGDLAYHVSVDGVESPGLAPAAIQQGQHAGAQIKRKLAAKPTEAFAYLDKGIMATVGRRRAVAKSGPFKFSGFLAWLAWLFIHIMFLVGFRNRFAVILEWAWAYMTYQRSARIILDPPPEVLERAASLKSAQVAAEVEQ